MSISLTRIDSHETPNESKNSSVHLNRSLTVTRDSCSELSARQLPLQTVIDMLRSSLLNVCFHQGNIDVQIRQFAYMLTSL